MNETFATRLKQAIRNSGKLVKEVSKDTGINKRTIDKWIGVNPTTPGVYDAVKIAQVLGTTVEELATGEDASLPPERLRPIIRDLSILNDADLEELEAIIAVKLNRYQEETKHA